MIGSIVKVTIDRPMGSLHPDYPDMYYPVNYGFVTEVLAPDGEYQDAYVLGPSTPIASFTGQVIAVIQRIDDIENKWVVAPVGVSYTKDEILSFVAFQEQYFQSEILM